MAVVRVTKATSAADIAAVRQLMQAYGNHLAAHPAGGASICIEGYALELEQLPENYAALLLATVDGEPAGCVALRKLKQDQQACEMKRLWIDPRFRGHGLGRRLVQEVIVQASRSRFHSIYLDTVPSAMPEANRLYASMGFLPVERYNDSPIADIAFFRKSLTPPDIHS